MSMVCILSNMNKTYCILKPHSLTSYLFLTYLRLPKTLHTFLIFPMLSFPFTWSLEYMTTSTHYKAPLSTTFSILLSLPPSWVKTFSSAPYSWTTSIHVPSHKTTGKTVVLHILMFVFVDKRRQNKLNWMVASILYI